MFNIKMIGKYCQRYRQKLGIPQSKVANELGYTTENISAFERGLNNNCMILWWYIMNGFIPQNDLNHVEMLSCYYRGVDDNDC